MSDELVKTEIRAKITELAAKLGHDAASLGDGDLIPRSGLLDSAALLRLILWYEREFDVSTDDEELTVDNFGSIELMADYLRRNKIAEA